VETNIVIFRVPDPKGLIEAVAGEVQLSTANGGRAVRAVTHMDVSREQIDEALVAIKRGLGV
jgi:threonine aldolase